MKHVIFNYQKLCSFQSKNDCRVFQLLIKLPFMLVLVHETVILFELSVPFLTHQGWQIYNKLLIFFFFGGGGGGGGGGGVGVSLTKK